MAIRLARKAQLRGPHTRIGYEWYEPEAVVAANELDVEGIVCRRALAPGTSLCPRLAPLPSPSKP
ncbi:hypothetical protein E2562_034367 [Oryza meyeriana var. granulata]|uniref:Uncharacterized protein n=1 Tax=Oryza meyeriana var. granulata TaxID=110450 RepID=A0A6G1FF71_9ORYZ|nr:hypothetical protein E2562_034367 [Oryza meyeriana var. granulata]